MKLSTDTLSSVARLYELEFKGLIAVDSGYRNTSHMFECQDGTYYNFILYKDEPGIKKRIERINELMQYVAQAGLPVRTPISSKVMVLSSAGSKRYGSMYTFLDGQTIAWEMYSMKHIKLLGMVLGVLHSQMKEFPGRALPEALAEVGDSAKRMKHYFGDTGVQKAMQSKLQVAISPDVFDRIGMTLSDHQLTDSRQPLHLDLVRGNVLFRPAAQADRFVVGGVALSGILDFEKAALGSPLLDIARTLSFLYVDCAKPASRTKKYFLQSGYVKRAGQTFDVREQNDLIESLVSMYLLYDFYKFLSQNPYESLAHNHHFVRTRDILLQRQLLY